MITDKKVKIFVKMLKIVTIYYKVVTIAFVLVLCDLIYQGFPLLLYSVIF